MLRASKSASSGVRTFLCDDWNLVCEREVSKNATNEIFYYWGKDLSRTLQGAGGVGGLLYLTVDAAVYVPFYYYYGYRFYSPVLRRWLNRDPIEEGGGLNLYGFCGNNAMCKYDKDGRAYFAIRGLGGLKNPVRFDGNLTFLDDWLNRKNLQIAHEQLFFQDGDIPSSVGYGKSDMDNENFDGYIVTDGGYDDCIMRMAVAKVNREREPYSLLGIFTKKYNCQDYASALRAKYAEIKDSQEAICNCKKKKGW